MQLPPGFKPVKPVYLANKGKWTKREWSILFLMVGAIFVLIGLRTLLSEDRVVGGDAFNYMISASRGTGEICAGLFFALVSVAIAIYDVGDKQKQK